MSILDEAFMQALVNEHHLRLQPGEDRSMCSPTNRDLAEAIDRLEGVIFAWRELRADLRQDDPMWILAGSGANMDRLVALAEDFVHEHTGHPTTLV